MAACMVFDGGKVQGRMRDCWSGFIAPAPVSYPYYLKLAPRYDPSATATPVVVLYFLGCHTPLQLMGQSTRVHYGNYNCSRHLLPMPNLLLLGSSCSCCL